MFPQKPNLRLHLPLNLFTESNSGIAGQVELVDIGVQI
jgi:hypothetical protein